MMAARLALAALLSASSALACAQPITDPGPLVPTVTVTGAASDAVPNDRMRATMRVEVEQAQAPAAASDVNARMAKALARAKAVAGVEARTAGYSTWQIAEKGKPARWRATQSLVLEGADFTALAALVTQLQEDGLLMTNMGFSVSPELRRRTEDTLTEQAIRAWQQRAALAAKGLGFPSWRPGRVTLSTNEPPRFEPMYRASVAAAPAQAPVAVEAGTTEISVTVSGEAVLERTGSR